MKRYYLLIFLFLFFILNLSQTFSQIIKKKEIGIPFITNYPTQIYKAYSQNWSIVQDKRGVLYVANGNGILEYDGVSWEFINVNDYLPVFALAIDSNNIIWVGTALEFGYLLPDEKGKMNFHSVNTLIENKDRKFSVKGKIFTTKYGVFYKTDTRLFRFYKGKISVHGTTDPSNCFLFNGNLYLWQKGIGLQIFEEEMFRLIRDGQKFAQREVLHILPYKEKSGFLLIDQEGVFHFDKITIPGNYFNLNLRKIHSQVDAFLNKEWLFDAIKLRNGNYALATLRDGTFIIDTTGSIVQHVDKTTGSFNNTHISLMESQYGSLWIAMDNGIARAELNSPISFWNDSYGLRGSVASVTRHNGRIYAGTYQGLYVMAPSFYDTTKLYRSEIFIHDFQFRPVDPVYIQCWDLYSIKNNNGNDVKLLAATSSGLFEVENEKAKLIAEGRFYKIFRSRKFPDLLFVGMQSGISVYNIGDDGKKLTHLCKLSGVKDKVISLEEDNEGRIWAGVRYNGIACFKPNLDDKNLNTIKPCEYEIYKFDTTDGLPRTEDILINRIFGDIVFLSEKGNYSFSEKNKHNENSMMKGFFEDNTVLTNGYKLKNYYIYTAVQDDLNQVWMQAISKTLKDNFVALAVPSSKEIGKFTFITEPFRIIPYTVIFSIYPESDGATWFGADDGLFRYDAASPSYFNKEFFALIRKVYIGKDSLFKYGTANIKSDSLIYGIPPVSFENSQFQHPVFSYEHNSVLFEYAAPTFFNEKYNSYSYYLDGFDDIWSDWTKETRKEYTNLPPGNYTFKVRARNIFQTISKEATFSFTIQPPWYRTIWAFLSYFMFFALVLYTITWYSNSRLRKSKERLEQIVRERTFEIITQKNLIEKEKGETEKVLLNILPKSVADELKRYGNARVQHYKLSTILFADFKGFTSIAEQLEPQKLILTLNKFFNEFDVATEISRVEKIKTIGDAYMCAGGVPISNTTNPADVVLLALKMIKIVENFEKPHREEGLSIWEIRIGINTGEVIAGVAGKIKYAYDIWGDAVNVAARMEASSEPGKINISESTFQYIKELFDCNFRGSIPAKNKGNINMYYVEKIKDGLSSDEEGIVPNENFWEKYNQIFKSIV